MKFRPWGALEWALSLSTKKNWFFLGALGTEQRSIASWKLLKQYGVISAELFAEIADVFSDKYYHRNVEALKERKDEFAQLGGNSSSIFYFDLMSELFQINGIANKALQSESVVLDITSFPKRFFFPILRALAKNPSVSNLLITYTSPAAYAEDAPLYEDIENWKTLPGFGGGDSKADFWVVSVGFLVESLRRYVGDNPQDKMKLLIPFPAPLAALRRTWQSVADLEQGHEDDRFDKYRVDTLDISAAFDRIASIAGKPERALAFAPFGPKPTSAAMCLYAMQKDSSVHYSQPTVYHPDYSKGIKNDSLEVAVNAYWVKHQGEFLYAI